MGEQMILSECLEKQIIETDARKGVVKKVCSVVLLTLFFCFQSLNILNDNKMGPKSTYMM